MPDDYMVNASLVARKKQVYEVAKIARAIPSVGIFDEPTRCYKINKQWARIVMGFTSLLIDPATWLPSEGEDYLPIEQIRQFLIGTDCEMPIDLRQNPLNDCQLEYSTDGGDTWILAFDYSLCVPDFAQTIINNTTTIIQQSQTTNINNMVENFTNNVWNNYVNNYINSIGDIAPELVYGDDDDTYRDAALCDALGKFVDSVCDSAIAYFDEVNDTANDLRTTLALAAAIIGIVALAATGVGALAAGGLAVSAGALATQAGLWGAGIALGSALGGALVDHFVETNQEAYEDASARQEVVCCLLNALKSSSVDRDDFSAAFACGGLSTNAQAIHDAASILANEDAMYAAFVENYRVGYNSAKLGLLVSCACPYPSMIEYDFAASDGGFIALNASTYNVAGYWDGVEDTPFPGTSKTSNVDIQIEYPVNAYIMGIGANWMTQTDCGTSGSNLQVFDDGVFVGGFSQSPVQAGANILKTHGLTTPDTYHEGNQVRINVSGRLCDGTFPDARIFKVRVWFHADSPIKGIEVATLPYGVGANGTNDMSWWL